MSRLPYVLSALVALYALVQSATQRRARRRSPLWDLLDDRYSLVVRPVLAMLALGVFAGGLSVAIPWGLAIARGWARATPVPGFSLTTAAWGGAAVLLHVLYAAVEELVFRGALLAQLTKQTRPATALTLSALVFAASYYGRPGVDHLSVYSLLILALQGAGLGAMFLATRTLWAPLAWTATRNLLLWALYGEGVSFGFPVGLARFEVTSAGARWVGGPLDGGPVDALATALIVLVTVLLSRRHLAASRLEWLRDDRPPRIPLT